MYVIDYQEFGAKLRELRQNTGLSLRHVARHAGISSTYLSDAELGRRILSAGKVKKIASVLGLPDGVVPLIDPRRDWDAIFSSCNSDSALRQVLGDLCRKVKSRELTADEIRTFAEHRAPKQ